MIRRVGQLMVTRGCSHIIDITLYHFYYFHMCVWDERILKFNWLNIPAFCRERVNNVALNKDVIK